ncbi:hypothetical protein [Peptostreptococcus equinus]|uniref:Uncharacterized protein n=1 Tax=Peptostreptococcus equinus TaxID=3003601 RepID=A0ABY7JPM1_9FIRM|nr:hypothetical protein [Peptostreptococcus sp. CBA3647]WAW15312.1 hypothetical protein O0R46_02335 [Peptostreptococcus sp. CBA3647]
MNKIFMKRIVIIFFLISIIFIRGFFSAYIKKQTIEYQDRISKYQKFDRRLDNNKYDLNENGENSQFNRANNSLSNKDRIKQSEKTYIINKLLENTEIIQIINSDRKNTFQIIASCDKKDFRNIINKIYKVNKSIIIEKIHYDKGKYDIYFSLL